MLKNKILSSVLSATMIASMGVSAFAAENAAGYLTPVSGTEYTTMISSTTTSVPLEVYMYNGGNYEGVTGISWEVTSDDNDIITNGDTAKGAVVISEGEESGLTTSIGTVGINTGKTGAAVVRATKDASTYIDLIIAADTSSVSQNAVRTKVYVVDDSTDTANKMVENVTASVYAPAKNAMAGLLAGKSKAFQNQATVMGTLDALKKDNKLTSVTLADDASYVQDINGLQWGWVYALYDTSGNHVNVSESIGAAVSVLPANNYTVVWKFIGSQIEYDFADTLTAEIASW